MSYLNTFNKRRLGHPATRAARSCRVTNALAGAVGLVLASSAGAAGWEFNPRIEAGYLYDDNYRLELPANEVDVSGGLLDAEVELRNATQTNRFSLFPRVRTTYFPDERDEDSTDYFLRAQEIYQTQRSRFELRAGFSEETVARTEQPIDDADTDIDIALGEGGGADAGRTTIRNRRQLIDLNPRLRHDLGQRQQVEVGARYRNVDFDREVVNAQVPYDESELSVGWGYEQSPRTTLLLRGLANWYNPDRGNYDANGYGLQGEWNLEVSETTRAYVRVGAQRTEIDRGTRVTRDTDYIAGVGGQWSGQLYSSLVDLTRTVGPTASGFIVNRDQLRLRFNRSFSERMRGFAGLRAARDEATEPNVAYAERRYVSGSLGLEWLFSRTFSVAGSYDHTWQEFADEPDDRKSQGFTISFIYQPVRREAL